MRRSRPARFIAILGLIGVLQLGGAATASADHCGADAKIAPSAGAGGTTFVVRPQLGATTILKFYRDDHFVFSVQLADPALRYAFHSRSGDAGSWRAEARVKGHTECGSEVAFAITGLPTTSTVADIRDGAADMPAVPLALLVLTGLVGGVAGWRRSRRPTS